MRQLAWLAVFVGSEGVLCMLLGVSSQHVAWHALSQIYAITRERLNVRMSLYARLVCACALVVRAPLGVCGIHSGKQGCRTCLRAARVWNRHEQHSMHRLQVACLRSRHPDMMPRATMPCSRGTPCSPLASSSVRPSMDGGTLAVTSMRVGRRAVQRPCCIDSQVARGSLRDAALPWACVGAIMRVRVVCRRLPEQVLGVARALSAAMTVPL